MLGGVIFMPKFIKDCEKSKYSVGGQPSLNRVVKGFLLCEVLEVFIWQMKQNYQMQMKISLLV